MLTVEACRRLVEDLERRAADPAMAAGALIARICHTRWQTAEEREQAQVLVCRLWVIHIGLHGRASSCPG
jgi:hypothetical protein